MFGAVIFFKDGGFSRFCVLISIRFDCIGLSSHWTDEVEYLFLKFIGLFEYQY